MAAQSIPSATLSSLSPEVLLMIVEELDAGSKFTLRQTCRFFHAAIPRIKDLADAEAVECSETGRTLRLLVCSCCCRLRPAPAFALKPNAANLEAIFMGEVEVDDELAYETIMRAPYKEPSTRICVECLQWKMTLPNRDDNDSNVNTQHPVPAPEHWITCVSCGGFEDELCPKRREALEGGPRFPANLRWLPRQLSHGRIVRQVRMCTCEWDTEVLVKAQGGGGGVYGWREIETMEKQMQLQLKEMELERELEKRKGKILVPEVMFAVLEEVENWFRHTD